MRIRYDGSQESINELKKVFKDVRGRGGNILIRTPKGLALLSPGDAIEVNKGKVKITR